MWRNHLESQDREVLTGRTSSMVMCGRPKGNGVEGAVGGCWGRLLSPWRRAAQLGRRGTMVVCGVRGWWSAARGAGRSYSAVRCSGCGRIIQREVGVGYSWWLSGPGYGGGQSGTGAVKWWRRKKKGAPRCGGAPFIAAEAVDDDGVVAGIDGRGKRRQ
jgi:hypothetical protein